MAIRDWPCDERPREKLLDKGAAALSDAELLAILLRTGTRGYSALDLARDVLKSFHSLRKLIAADRQRFCAERGLGPARFAELQAAVEIARRQLVETLRAGPSLASPRATRDFLSSQLRDLEHEVFCCLYLDKRHRLIQFQELFRGTIDGASVHPREIVKLALQRNPAQNGVNGFTLRASRTKMSVLEVRRRWCNQSFALQRRPRVYECPRETNRQSNDRRIEHQCWPCS